MASTIKVNTISNVDASVVVDVANIAGKSDVHSATAKTVPVDADEIGLVDSEATFGLKKLSWADWKASIISVFGVLISGLTAKATPVGADVLVIGDSASSFASKKATLTSLITLINPTFVANDSRAKTALNAAGNAPIYACRAWVNFNGTGTVAIRASGNVSSITDRGVGQYTVNFTTAMPDVKYSTQSSGDVSGIESVTEATFYATDYTTSSCYFAARDGNGVTLDSSLNQLALFR